MDSEKMRVTMLNDKIKVLQFPIGNRKGGMTQYVLSNWNHIDRAKFHFDFAVMDSYVSFEEELLEQGCVVHHISRYAEDDEKAFYENFRSLIEKGQYDAVHLHTLFWKSWTAERAAKDAGIKRIIVHAHSTGITTGAHERKEAELRHHRMMVSNLRQNIATDYWACSWEAAEFLFGGRIPKRLIRIMPNAIDIKRFVYQESQRHKIRARLGLDNCFVIGHVGRLAYPKNQLFLLHIMKDLCEHNSSVRLLLVGEGDDKECLEAYARANGLEEYVFFTGFRRDTEKLLQAFDIFVFPSFFEAFPIALLEAQAAGLHCYVSDSIAMETNVTGNVFFLPLNEVAWRERLLDVSRHSYKRENMYDIMTRAGFNIQNQIKELEKGYRGEL